jgi:lipopolysaccharide transport system permease protein
VFFRDLAQLLPPALTVVMYLSPILYPEGNVPERLRFLLLFNPVRDLAGLFRAGLFGGAIPDPVRLAAWAALFLVIAYGGAKFFRRCRPSFADLL